MDETSTTEKGGLIMNYSIEYYKEKDTDPMVFLQRFRCTTEPIGGSTEHDEEGELISWDAAVAAIEIAKKQLGWHPASELPQLDENESSDLVCALGKVFSKEFGEYIDKVPCRVRVIHGKWAPEDIKVKWWCYPPRKEE